MGKSNAHWMSKLLFFKDKKNLIKPAQRSSKSPDFKDRWAYFTTHLLERSMDIRYIQFLLGHNSSETTEIYTHITQKAKAKLCSPLDFLDI